MLLGGHPVQGAQVRIDGWLVPELTDKRGSFIYPADITMPGRHVVKVVGDAEAEVDGHKLNATQRSAVLRGKGSISVGYKLEGLAARSGPEGSIVVTGRVVYGNGTAPPPVLLYSYLLRGTITDANGKPVKGAVVTTRTADRQYWTQSRPSGANGSYAVVPRRRRHAQQRPRSDDRRRGGRGYRVRRAGDRLDRVREAEERGAEHPASGHPRRAAAEDEPEPAADPGEDLPGPARGRRRRARPRDQAAERALADRGRAVPARAAELRPRIRGEVLGGRSSVLLRLGGPARRTRSTRTSTRSRFRRTHRRTWPRSSCRAEKASVPSPEGQPSSPEHRTTCRSRFGRPAVPRPCRPPTRPR